MKTRFINAFYATLSITILITLILSLSFKYAYEREMEIQRQTEEKEEVVEPLETKKVLYTDIEQEINVYINDTFYGYIISTKVVVLDNKDNYISLAYWKVIKATKEDLEVIQDKEYNLALQVEKKVIELLKENEK